MKFLMTLIISRPENRLSGQTKLLNRPGQARLRPANFFVGQAQAYQSLA